jgi:hypothetical protein
MSRGRSEVKNMPMHPHAKPNFRNLFWYPFKITSITALRTFPIFGKYLERDFLVATTTQRIQNSSMTVQQKSRASKSTQFNDISQQEFAPDRVTSDLFPTYGSLKPFNIPYERLKIWNLGFSFQETTTEE